MLEEIRISSLGVIDSSTLELGPGLTVITGETGAGKTMVVTALGLLLGGRADTGAVRSGARNARVEGVVTADALPGLAAAVHEAGGEVEDDRVVLARNISAEGRSRAWVGGATVPASTLAAVAEPLVAVHGQSDQHRLLRSQAQREALDRFGGAKVQGLLETCERPARAADDDRERAPGGRRPRHVSGPERPTSSGSASARSRRCRPSPARTPRWRPRSRGSDSPTPCERQPSWLASRCRATRTPPTRWPPRRRPARPWPVWRDHDPEAAALSERLAEITYLLSDVAADVASYAARLETDPARLGYGESERRAALTALTRKYGDTVDEVLAWSAEASTTAARPRRHRRADRGAASAAPGAADRPGGRRQGAVGRTHRGSHPARPTGHRGADPAGHAACSRRGRRRASTRPARRPTTWQAARSRSGSAGCEPPRRASTRSSSCSPPTPAPRHAALAQGRVRWRALAGHAGARGGAGRHQPGADLRLRRGRRRGGRQGGHRGGPAAGAAGPHRAGAGGHPPAPGGGVRRPPRGGGEVERRQRHDVRADRARRPTIASASCRGCWPDSRSPRRARAHARELLEAARSG